MPRKGSGLVSFNLVGSEGGIFGKFVLKDILCTAKNRS